MGGHGKEGHGQGGMARYLVRKAWETIAAHARRLQIGWYERALPLAKCKMLAFLYH